MAEVVYLTGAPATGKSMLTRALKAQIPDLRIFEFGERLRWLSTEDPFEIGPCGCLETVCVVRARRFLLRRFDEQWHRAYPCD